MQKHTVELVAANGLRRRGIPAVAFTVDSQEHDISLLDFFENVSDALEGLSEPEKRTARLNLKFRRMLDVDGRLDEVAVLNVVYARDETDDELADRQEQANRQAAANQSLREARDRVEFARLKGIFEPATEAA